VRGVSQQQAASSTRINLLAPRSKLLPLPGANQLASAEETLWGMRKKGLAYCACGNSARRKPAGLAISIDHGSWLMDQEPNGPMTLELIDHDRLIRT